jgi:hypothetical protein
MDILHLFLRRKAGYGDAIGGGRWIGGRSFEKSSHLLVDPLGKMAFLSTIWGQDRGAHCYLKAAAIYYSCCLAFFARPKGYCNDLKIIFPPFPARSLPSHGRRRGRRGSACGGRML